MEDVLVAVDISPEHPPFFGEPATRIAVPVDAQADITRSRPARSIDEFDIDVRIGRGKFSAFGFELSRDDPCFVCSDTEQAGTCRFRAAKGASC